ncbi:MAG: arylamine N-acetyltransferase [Acidobacteriota bacterium]|nr:arylamine N-acetyltransferase [Acidobacteriota bacterium]
MLARVRDGGPAQPASPLTHLLLRFEHEGQLWHADVGCGSGTLLAPIPFGARTSVRAERLALSRGRGAAAAGTADRDRGGLARPLRVRARAGPTVDIEVNNWVTCTHPVSTFVTRLLATEHSADGSSTTLSDFGGEMALSVQTPTGSTREPVAREVVPDLLWERFGLREPEPGAE